MAAEHDGTAKKGKTPAAAKGERNIAEDKKRKRKGDGPAPGDVPTEQSPGAAAAPAARAEAGAGGPARKKHKRTSEEQLQSLDPAEAARRRRQRELQAVALKLRAEGREYVHSKGASQPRNREQPDGAGKGAKGGDKKGRHYLGDKTPGWRPFSTVEVIVLPIFWNNNKEEKQAVLAASERARDILASAGLSVDMDASNKYTPGQKMKYWETMGVRVRLELGPRDVANGNCVVALSTKEPGEVASKSVVNMRHKMLDAVREALRKAKSAAPADADEGGEGGAAQRREEPVAEAEEPPRQRAKGGKRKQDATAGGVGDEANQGEEEDEEGDVVAAAVAATNRTAKPEVRKLKQQRGRGQDQASAGPEAEESEQEQEDTGADDADGTGGRGAGAAAPFSADALEDDFGDVVEFEAEEDKLTLTKKERLKKAVKKGKAKRQAERRAGMEAGDALRETDDGGRGPKDATARGKAAGKKKAKVVSF